MVGNKADAQKRHVKEILQLKALLNISVSNTNTAFTSKDI